MESFKRHERARAVLFLMPMTTFMQGQSIAYATRREPEAKMCLAARIGRPERRNSELRAEGGNWLADDRVRRVALDHAARKISMEPATRLAVEPRPEYGNSPFDRRVNPYGQT